MMKNKTTFNEEEISSQGFVYKKRTLITEFENTDYNVNENFDYKKDSNAPFLKNLYKIAISNFLDLISVIKDFFGNFF